MVTNEPKLATAAGEAERVVRDLLDAFNSLKAIPAPPTCSPPAEEKRPVQVQEGCEQGSEPVKGNAPSDIGEQEPEQNLALKGAGISEHPPLVPTEDVLALLRDDHELIERLKITPEELDALAKCAMLGTLTSKQHMLFILRQIREAGGPALASPALDQAPRFPEPALAEEQDPVPRDWRVAPPLDSAAMATRRHLSGYLGVFLWSLVMLVGLALVAVSLWHINLLTRVGIPAAPATPSAPWYTAFDQFHNLLWVEALPVLAIAAVIYRRSLRSQRRPKIRPGRGWR